MCFNAVNVKVGVELGQVRGVAMLAAATAGLEVAEYAPLSIKSAVVGYGKAEKQQVQHMVTLLLELAELPEPVDASDALANAICICTRRHAQPPGGAAVTVKVHAFSGPDRSPCF